MKKIKTVCCYLSIAVNTATTLLIIPSTPLSAQTIAEKKAGMNTGSFDLTPDMQSLLNTINQERLAKQSELQKLYKQTTLLYEQQAPQKNYCDLLERINVLKTSLAQLDEKWRNSVSNSTAEEGYALWHQPESSLEQLVMDYGSQDYVYLIPEEIGTMKISIMSNLPIPRTAWNEMLDVILAQNGVGMRQLNTYLRELYLLEPPNAAVKVITNRRDDLKVFPSNMRIAFILTPESIEVHRTWFFLEKFINPNSTVAQLIGRDILLIGKSGEIQDLLKISDFVANNKGSKDYKLVTLSSVDANQMAMLLESIFDTSGDGPKTSNSAIPLQRIDFGLPHLTPKKTPKAPSIAAMDGNGLKVIPIVSDSQALFLIGTKEEIHKAEEVIREVEVHLADVRQKVIFWYTAKHSDAEELAEVLDKVYRLMVVENVGRENAGPSNPANNSVRQESNSSANVVVPPPLPEIIPTTQQLYHESFYQDGNVVINPAPIAPNGFLVEQVVNENRNNFIVDLKTGSIVMVVEAEFLPKLKDLIRKLDVPKKMVRIEILLVEKRLTNTTNYGLNLLKIGCNASNKNCSGLGYDGCKGPLKGIFSLMLSQAGCHGIPAFDLTYNFLLSQEDVQINANPSVTTVNQTPASISIQDEISINTGIFEIPVVGSNALKEAFTRAQYGIKLEITPTIHVREEIEGFCDNTDLDYITLDTILNIDTFDNVRHTDRPNVTRRQIVNQVLVADGQTVILGGLRKKSTEDSRESIPFLGELPGLGKLFSTTRMSDCSVEMFIFITPKIIYDPVDDQEKIKLWELCKRPGDVPEFLCDLEEARTFEKQALMQGSMQMLFGRPPERCIYAPGEYDGR